MFNNKENNCTKKSIDIVDKRGPLSGCVDYKRDMKWLRHSWWDHEYMWIPVDDAGLDLVPVKINKVEELQGEKVIL